jgi:hypothetical protein
VATGLILILVVVEVEECDMGWEPVNKALSGALPLSGTASSPREKTAKYFHTYTVNYYAFKCTFAGGKHKRNETKK